VKRAGLLAAAAVFAGALAANAGDARADDAACIAANEHAVLLLKQSRLRDALRDLAQCAAPTCPAEVAAECGRRVAETNQALPTIVLHAKGASGEDLVAVGVALDGAPLAGALDGRAIPLDPGAHKLRFEAAGMPAVEQTILVGEGEKARPVTVVLGPAAGPRVDGGGSRRAALITAGAVLGAAVITTTIAGITAVVAQDKSSSLCPTTTCTDPHAVDLNQEARTAAWVADIGLGVGVAALATAGVLWLKSPAKPGSATLVAPIVGNRSRGVALVQTF
jgi:hypothetical protein